MAIKSFGFGFGVFATPGSPADLLRSSWTVSEALTTKVPAFKARCYFVCARQTFSSCIRCSPADSPPIFFADRPCAKMELRGAARGTGPPANDDNSLPKWTQLHGLLEAFVLPHIAGTALASLRATCKTFQVLVDQAPLDCVWPVLSQHMPKGQLPEPADSQAAQERLRWHAACIRSVLAGTPSRAFSAKVILASSHHQSCCHHACCSIFTSRDVLDPGFTCCGPSRVEILETCSSANCKAISDVCDHQL